MITQNSHDTVVQLGPEAEMFSQGRTTIFGLPAVSCLTLLAHNKRLIALVAASALFVGAVISFLMPVRYSATTKIMTPQQSPSSATMLMMSQLANSAGGGGALGAITGGLSLRNPNDLYIGILNARPVADRLIERFGLEQDYRERNLTDTRKILARYTNITPERSGLIAISVTDRDRARSADLANAYTAELSDLMKSLALTDAGQRRVFYEEQLQHAKDDLVKAEFAFQQIQQKKGLVALDAQTKALIESMATLHGQIAAKQVEVQALHSYSTDRNPELQLAENELASLQAQASQLEQRSHSPNTAVAGLQDLAGEGIEYVSAEHELQYRQVLFDILLKQYDAAKLDEAKDAPLIQVVERAVPPEVKSEPHRARITLIFAFLGWLFACLYVIAREHVRRNPELAQSLAGLGSAIRRVR
jgi:uncharacterized protein involved in exopolysaccharide biosynthesis